ncbi:MAG: Arsenic efflux pump protein, partial [Candidatus Bathyarchaeota archaeon B23]
MNALQLLSLAIFLFILLLIVSESIHRTYAALIGAGIFLLLGVVSPERLLEYVELDILCIVFGMMLLVRGAERSGIFSYIAARMVGLSPSSTLLAVLLLTFTMILTIFLNNIGAMLVSATLTLLIAQSGELRPQTILIFQAIVTNVGGLVLMVSSIPNIIVALEGGLPFGSFITTMTPMALLLYAATLALYLRELKGEQLERRELRPLNSAEWVESLLGVRVEMDLEREI